MRRGAALPQIIVIAVILVAAAVAMMKWQLQRHQLSAKAAAQSGLKMDADGAKSAFNACLGAAGYPSGSCQPDAAQAACVPPGATVSFSGIPPDCRVDISAVK